MAETEHNPDAAAFLRAARLLSLNAPNHALAKALGRSRSTVRSWTSGRRRPPVDVYRLIQEALQQQIGTFLSQIQELKIREWIRQAQPPPPRHRGFLVIKVREPGGKPRDARWRLGRPRRTDSDATGRKRSRR